MGTISFSEALKLKDKVFVDVRTPLEFSRDHIYDAINIPVLSNEQRAIVGTIYKKEDPKKAVDVGIDYFSEKLPKIIKELRKYEGKKIIVYCWRGGMRSGAFVSFLRSLNFDIIQLNGGYKFFREYIREYLYNFDIKPKTFCIYGMTGTGKTEIIKKLYPDSVDLEGLAGHRSSIFGHVGLEQRSQKMFESLLLSEMLRVNDLPHIFLEGESRRVGDINLPKFIFERITDSEQIKVYSDIKVRAKLIVAEYFDTDAKIEQVRDVLDSRVLLSRLGQKNVDFMKDALAESNYGELVELLLEKYYDPMYKHSQKKLKGAVEICSDDIDEAVEKIKEYVKSQHLRI